MIGYCSFVGLVFLLGANAGFVREITLRKPKIIRVIPLFASATRLSIPHRWEENGCPTLGDARHHLLAGEAASRKKLVKLKANGRVRLFCIYGVADAALSLRSWIQDAPEWLEVRLLELPGHGYLAKEQDLPPCSYSSGSPLSREELREQLQECIVQELADQMVPLLYKEGQDKREKEPVCYALYGFSWGAMIAYELCLELERRDHHPPVLLSAAGRGAPHAILYSDEFSEELQLYSDSQLLEFVQESMAFPLDGLPAKRLARAASLFRCGMILSGLHAGTTLLSNSTTGTETPRHIWEDIQAPILRASDGVALLNCPVLSLGASEDKIRPNQHIKYWREATNYKGKHICFQDLNHEQLMNAAVTKEAVFGELTRYASDGRKSW